MICKTYANSEGEEKMVTIGRIEADNYSPSNVKDIHYG